MPIKNAESVKLDGRRNKKQPATSMIAKTTKKERADKSKLIKDVTGLKRKAKQVKDDKTKGAKSKKVFTKSKAL